MLVVDAGNTRIKAAIFEGDALLEQFVLDSSEVFEGLGGILRSNPGITDLVVASVGNAAVDSLVNLSESVTVHLVDHKTIFPFENKYQTPTTLGVDRMVLATGAVLQYPKQNRLVIDAGTCVTYDFIDDADCYLGGAISPGIRLRYEALHRYTARLPLLSLDQEMLNGAVRTTLIGDSTAGSIHSGVINGIVNEIDGFIAQYEVLYSNFIIILTGGDAEVLAKRLKNTIFANSNFLLESLNQTYLYKIKND